MINQIKNLVDDIEQCSDKKELFIKHLELSKLILYDLPSINEEDIKEMSDEELLSDAFYEIDEASKILSNFINLNISFIEADLKGSDFETELKNNSRKIEELKARYISEQQKHKELQYTNQEAERVQFEIDELQIKIDEFAQVDLEKMGFQKEQMSLKLIELKKAEGNNLKIYKRHLEENRGVTNLNTKLIDLSNSIKNSLIEMDEVLAELIKEEK